MFFIIYGQISSRFSPFKLDQQNCRSGEQNERMMTSVVTENLPVNILDKSGRLLNQTKDDRHSQRPF